MSFRIREETASSLMEPNFIRDVHDLIDAHDPPVIRTVDVERASPTDQYSDRTFISVMLGASSTRSPRVDLIGVDASGNLALDAGFPRSMAKRREMIEGLDLTSASSVRVSNLPDREPPWLPNVPFMERLLRFTSWSPNWDGDGAAHIDVRTAIKALVTAQACGVIAGDAFVAPSPDGSLLLQWDFRDGSTVELFIEESGFESAVIVKETEVKEVPLTGLSDLRRLLYQRALAT